MDEEQWEFKLAGGEMSVYIGVDMARDRFDYCAIDRDLNILCRKGNQKNNNSSFDSFLSVVKGFSGSVTIGMESTGIYHMPLYNYLRNSGYSVRMLNGLEVRGMKNSRVRKTTNDTIDAELIAKYLIMKNGKKIYTVPDNMKNLKELITAYSIIGKRIREMKNSIVRLMDLSFPGLSNIISINAKTLEMLEKYHTPDDFIHADLKLYVTARKAETIRKTAIDAPANTHANRAITTELQALIRILNTLSTEKENIGKAMSGETENHIIMTVPGIGAITGSVIIGKVCGISRFENAEKLVAFAGIDPVIRESGKKRSGRAISKRGDSTLRSAIYQSTLAAVRSNPVISEFYCRKVDSGMPKRKALIAASRKQCHIIWSVWHNNKPFEVPESFKK